MSPHDDEPSSPSLLTFTTRMVEPATGPRVSLLLYHRDGSQMIPLADGQMLVVGRARPADVPIRDHSLSRRHARFEYVNDELWVEDLGSTNGTRINGKKVRRSRVSPNDEVQLGAVTAALHVLAPNESVQQGLESHDRFIAKLEQEVVRARTFGRSLGLLMVRAAKRKQAHISRWGPRVGQLLRPVDFTSLYDQSSVLICLPESNHQLTLQVAEGILARKQKGDPQLLCGVGVFPDHASSTDELLEAVRLAAQKATGRQTIQVASGEREAPPDLTDGQPVVVSPRMHEIFETARRISDSAIPVLIYGETGTGKEVLARTIHESGNRKRKPLRCINCASIPEQLVESALFGHERGAFTSADKRAKGIFEEANGGTVLLDEIGELSPTAQASLLRAIETKKVSRVGSSKEFPVDVRILAATHRDLEKMCEAGEFRWDLFYRLNTMVLRIPPLRQRTEEILPMARAFTKAAAKANQCKISTIDPEAGRLLEAYHWPGNVRELRNVIDRAVVIAQDATIVAEDLSERLRRSQVAGTGPRPESPEGDEDLSIKEKLKRYESQLLLDALEQNDWNQTQTAKVLEMPLRTLVHKMRQYNLKKKYGQS